LSFIKRHLDAWQPALLKHFTTEDRFMRHLEVIRGQFADVAKRPDDQIDLVEAALLIARTAFPDLVSSQCVERLDRWADRLRSRLDASPSAGEILSNLNRILFDEAGFQGNQENYYDPQNSFLNRVLERRLGIPITLSLVYSEVGRRAGFPVHGIALPGHFLVGLLHESGTLYVDPFNRGEVLTEKECCDRVEAGFGPEAAADAGWKVPAGKKMILKRMLRNLKGIYRQLNQEQQVFEMLQWILALNPESADELKQRGLLYEAMGNNASAVKDLERYLEIAPAAPDREMIEAKIKLLQSQKGWLH
jgi:regulator of sirC expression with transglutaminase-like and TPR domain